MAIDDKSLKGNCMPSLTVIISGTDIDIDLVEANTSGVEGASKKCGYEFHCTIFDKFPGLTRDESFIGAADFFYMAPCMLRIIFGG